MRIVRQLIIHSKCEKHAWDWFNQLAFEVSKNTDHSRVY